MEDQDLVQEEKVRKAAVRKSKMESGLMAEDADQQEKKAVSKDESIIYIHICIYLFVVYRWVLVRFLTLKTSHLLLGAILWLTNDVSYQLVHIAKLKKV